MDYNDLKIRMFIFFGALIFLGFLSWLNATHFDSTELAVIGGFAAGFAGLLFGGDLKNISKVKK